MAASYCTMGSSCSTYDSFTRLLIDTHVITFIKYNNNFVIFLRRIFCSETFFALIFFPNFFFPNLFFRASLLRKIFSEGCLPRRIFFRNIFFSERCLKDVSELKFIIFYKINNFTELLRNKVERSFGQKKFRIF